MNPPDFNNDHTIICVELLEVTLTHQQSKLTLKIKLENLLLYQSIYEIWWVEPCIYQEKKVQFGKMMKIIKTKHVKYNKCNMINNS